MRVVQRICAFLSLCFIMVTVLQVAGALAQTLTTDAPVDTKLLELGFKFFFGAVVPTVSPMITSTISHAVGGLPGWAKYLISSLMGLLQGGLAGAIPDFPVTIESGAEMGLATGAGGQFAWSHIPSESKAAAAPKP